MQNTDDIFEIDLKEVFGVILSRLWLILLCGIVLGAIGFCYSSFMLTPQYQSTTKVYILNKQNDDNVTYSDLQMGTVLTKDYKELIKSRNVLEKVIADCGLEEKYGSLAGRVTVEPISDTRILAITVKDPDPETAKYLADEIRKVAAKHIKQVMDIEAVNVVEEANLPERPSGPSVKKWTLLGFLLGAFLCVGVVLVRFLLDDTIKTSEDVEKYLGLSTLAMIPVMEDEESVMKKFGHIDQTSADLPEPQTDETDAEEKVQAEETKESAAGEEK